GRVDTPNGATRSDHVGLALSPDRSTAYLAGLGVSSDSVRGLVVIAYGVGNGIAKWVAKDEMAGAVGYAGPVVSPDGGEVAVTGFPVSGSDTFDWKTVAYSTR